MNKELEKLILDEPKIVGKNEDGFIGSIYVFVNKENGKIYVGKTVNSYLKRWKDHKNSVGKKKNRLYSAIEKYGWFGFERFVIYQTNIIESKEECNILILDKEIEFIKKFKSNNPEFGYNISEGGDGPVGLVHSEETKKKLSEVHSGQNHWNYGNLNNQTSHPVLQFDLDFNFIKEWPSIKEVERELGYKSNNIGRVCNNYSNSYKGFIWVKKADYYEGYLQEHKSRAKCKSNDKAVLQYDFSGNYIAEYISANEAGRALGKRSVVEAANGKSPQAYGYIWIYKQDFSEEKLSQKLKDIKNCTLYKKYCKEHGIPIN